MEELNQQLWNAKIPLHPLEFRLLSFATRSAVKELHFVSLYS